MIYVGIDVAKTNHYASIIDSNGEVIHEYQEEIRE